MRHMVGSVYVSVHTTLGSHVEMFATYSRYIKYEYVNKYNANGVVTELRNGTSNSTE